MKAKISFNGKEVEIEDIEKCSGFRRFTGLMFKNQNANALLFEFSKPTRQAIHSLFCPDFLAIWLYNNNNIVDYKFVNSNTLSIKPKKPFTKLLEIPINEKYSYLIKSCNSDEKRNI